VALLILWIWRVKRILLGTGAHFLSRSWAAVSWQAIVLAGIGIQECAEGFLDWTFESTFWGFEFTYDFIIIVTEIVAEASDVVSKHANEIVNEVIFGPSLNICV
jgi:hypothetical protein